MVSRSLVVLSACAAVATASLNITDTIPVAVPISQPPFSKSLSPNLVGFSLEFQFWPVYAGNATGQPNYYVNQLLSNLGERTGKTPALRVGGGSENNAYVDTSFQLWNSSHLDEVYGPFTNRANTTIGRDWYVVADNLLAGTEFTFGINENSQSEADVQSRMLAEAFQGSRADLTENVTLKFVQVGNEPNFYFSTATSYVEKWKPLIHNVLKNVKMGGADNTSLWVGSEIMGSGTTWRLTGTLEAGMLDDEDISNAVNVMEEHLYSGAMSIGAIPGGPPPGTLMNKASIRANLSTAYSGMLNTESYGRTYYLGETGSYASEGIFGLSNTGESAVWVVDYLLQAASMGIERAYLHSTPDRMFSVFQPGWGFTNGTGISRPHIMPMYNGLLVVDELIGTSGKAKIAEIVNESSGLAMYGAWEDGTLARMVLINSNVVTEGATARAALNVTFTGGITKLHATAKRLSIPYTTATEGISWAGQSFETASGVPSGETMDETVSGIAVTVAASEVVLLDFNTVSCQRKDRK